MVSRLAGGYYWTWTSDPLRVKQVLSRWAKHPILVTRTRIELVIPPWKGGVLTAWPTGLMVAAVGLEPTTLRVWTECSGQLSYAAICGCFYCKRLMMISTSTTIVKSFLRNIRRKINSVFQSSKKLQSQIASSYNSCKKEKFKAGIIFQLPTPLCYNLNARYMKQAEVVDTEAPSLIIYRSVRKIEHPIVRD